MWLLCVCNCWGLGSWFGAAPGADAERAACVGRAVGIERFVAVVGAAGKMRGVGIVQAAGQFRTIDIVQATGRGGTACTVGLGVMRAGMVDLEAGLKVWVCVRR